MPVTMDELLSNEAEADITIGHGTLHITYRPEAITPEMFRHVLQSDKPLPANATEAEVDARVYAAVDVLVPDGGVPLLTGWNLCESAVDGVPGPMIAITRDRLARVPLGILWGTIRGMMGASQMGEAAGTPSSPASPDTSAPAGGISSLKPASRASRKSSRTSK